MKRPKGKKKKNNKKQWHQNQLSSALMDLFVGFLMARKGLKGPLLTSQVQKQINAIAMATYT